MPKTATASIITNATELAQHQLILKNTHQAQVSAVKTIPGSSILQTSSGATHTSLAINYQPQPVTLAFTKPAEPSLLLLLKQNRLNLEVEQPTSSPTTSNISEAVHYVTVCGNQLHNIYVPAQQGFHIPVSG